MPLNKLRHFVPRNARHLLHGNEAGALVPVLNRHQHQGFTPGTASPLSPGTAPSNQRIIHLNQIVQAVYAIPMSYGNANLAQHPDWAVTHDTSICLDNRMAEMPPLSEATR